MDFTTTEAAQDLGGLVDTIVDAVCTPEHQRELDKLEQRFDRELWRKLIDAGILSSAAPESLGGDGFGVLEQVAVLVALGHQLAAVPYLESVVLAAGALARFGSPELQQGWGCRRSPAIGSSPSPSTVRWARVRCRPPAPDMATASPAHAPRSGTARWPTHFWYPPKPIPVQPFSWLPPATQGLR